MGLRARLSAHTRYPLRSVTCARSAPLSRVFLLSAALFHTRTRKIALELLGFPLGGLIGFNWSLMEGDAGHRSPVSDIELGCIRGEGEEENCAGCFVR